MFQCSFFHRCDFKILPYIGNFKLFENGFEILQRQRIRDKWWIQDFPEVGVPALEGEGATYDFARVFQKLHETERIWTRGGGGRRPKFYYVDPPLAIYGVVFLHLLNPNIILNITFCLQLVLKENENCKYFKDVLYFCFAKMTQL